MKKTNRNSFFVFVFSFLKIFKWKPQIITLDKEIKKQGIYLCNHKGSSGLFTMELYFPQIFRFWGTHEMTESWKERYDYLANTYFQNKIHLNKFFAHIVAVIALPIMVFFYWGINLLPTYKNIRLIKTIKRSINELKNDVSIVIFPENSDKGYLEFPTEFRAGFFVLAKKAYKEGLDLPIYPMHYFKKGNYLVIGHAIKFSEIKDLSRYNAAKLFCDKANALKEINRKDYNKKKN